MKLRIIIEVAIVIAFITVALLVTLVRGVDTAAKASGNAVEYVQVGDKLYQTGRAKFNEAALKYWEAIKLNPDMPDPRFKLAAIQYENIWNYEALYQLGEVEKIAPNYPGLYLLKGKIYNRLGDTEKSLESLEKAVIAQPGNSEARYFLGTVYQQQNMEEQAIKEYEAAVQSRSDNTATVNSYLQLGRIFSGKKKLEEAEKEFKAALSLDPASTDVISELRSLYRDEAEEYESKNQFDKAAEKYSEMVKVDPENPRNAEIYMILGNIYRSNELYDKAEAMYESAIKFDPTNLEAFGALKELELLKKNK